MTVASQYTLPLSTLLTAREVELMGYKTMGSLFKHQTVKTAEGTVMLFSHEAVRAWGEERIAALRKLERRGLMVGEPCPPRRLKRGECAECGRVGARVHHWYQDPLCPACFAKAEQDDVEYEALSTALERAITDHLKKYQGSRPLRAVIDADGGLPIELLHQIVMRLLEEDLYGKEEACDDRR